MTKTDEFCNQNNFDDRKRHHLMQTVAQAIAKIETLMPNQDQNSANNDFITDNINTSQIANRDDARDEPKPIDI